MRPITTAGDLIAADISARPGPTTLSRTSPRSGSSAALSSAASSTSTSEPHRSPGQDWRPSSGTPQVIAAAHRPGRLLAPHRFQYEPYAFRQPSLTRAETTGMYSAKVGAGGLAAGAASRSAGVRPMRSSTSMAASATACPGAAERASGPVIVIGLLLHVPGTGYARPGPDPPPRANTRSA